MGLGGQCPLVYNENQGTLLYRHCDIQAALALTTPPQAQLKAEDDENSDPTDPKMPNKKGRRQSAANGPTKTVSGGLSSTHAPFLVSKTLYMFCSFSPTC